MADSEGKDEGKDVRVDDRGFFDHVAAIFAAHQHPIIMVEHIAMRWMGLKVPINKNLDLLVRDSQLQPILADLMATGLYENVEQNLASRLSDPYVKQVPRLRPLGEDSLDAACLSLWSESVHLLEVDGPLVEVPELEALNTNVKEECFDPGATATTVSLSYSSLLARGVRLEPSWSAQSPESKQPVYIPTIPRLLDSLLDQQRYRKSHAETYQYQPSRWTLPGYHLDNFVRYLHLEKEHQRGKVLPLLAERNRGDMEARMKKFKRKPSADLARGIREQANTGKVPAHDPAPYLYK
ncbi:MAG: hypothetical protein M1817_001510 [Caeruleum heppii]|nr:MAG: hypothetical protein M1817_001510 [Caeruleum heppii]